jgi:site-specific recombinase XerD
MSDKIIKDFLNHKEAQGFSLLTSKNYLSDLNIFRNFLFDTFNESKLTIGLLGKVDNRTLDKFLLNYPNLSTKNRKLYSVKSFYKYLERNRQLENRYVREYKCKKVPEVSPIKRSDLYTSKQIEKMESACDKTRSPLRNKLILNLLRTTGMRPREISEININFLNLDKCKGRVKRKGGVERPFRFSKKTRNLLIQYINENKSEIKKRNGKLFSLNYNGIYSIIKLLGDKCGFHACPKVFRHLWASEGRNKGMDPILMEELGGWKSSKMLKRYGHMTEQKEKMEYDRVWGER